MDCSKISKNREVDRELCDRMIKRGKVKTSEGGWKTALEGWNSNKRKCIPVTNEAAKKQYQDLVVNARSHIALKNAVTGSAMRKEIYAFAPAMVLESIKQTELSLSDPWHGTDGRKTIQKRMAEMHQTMAELCCVLAEDGEVGCGVKLPYHGERPLRAEELHNIGSEHAKKAMEMRREGGEVENPNAMGAILFWLAKNELGGSSVQTPDRLFRMVQESRTRMEQLGLPEGHFREKQIQELSESLEKTMYACFTPQNASGSDMQDHNADA